MLLLLRIIRHSSSGSSIHSWEVYIGPNDSCLRAISSSGWCQSEPALLSEEKQRSPAAALQSCVIISAFRNRRWNSPSEQKMPFDQKHSLIFGTFLHHRYVVQSKPIRSGPDESENVCVSLLSSAVSGQDAFVCSYMSNKGPLRLPASARPD